MKSLNPARITLPFLALAMLAVPVASAQDDACSQSDPCPWALDVYEAGFDVSDESLNATIDDWYTLNIFNLDDVAHTITLEGHGVQVTVAPLEEATSAPFQLTQAGVFSLDDEPTGDFVLVQVFETDVVDEEADAATTAAGNEDAVGKDQPLPLTVALGALLVSAFLLRRR